MSRGLSSPTIAALSSDNINLCTLIQFDFSSAITITDCDRDVTAGAVVFSASPHILSLGSISESSELKVNSTSIVLSAVEQTYVSLFLSNPHIGIRTRVWKAALNDSDVVQGDPVLIFDGLITGYEIEDRGTQSRLTVSLASHWKDFEKKSGRKTNHNMQQLHFPSDDGFLYASSGGRPSYKTDSQLKWG